MADIKLEDSQRKIAFVFPSAGAQKVGMGAFLKEFDKSPFERAGELFEVNLEQICLEGPVKTLNLAQFTNIAIYSQSIATYELMISRNIVPSAVIGYSLGEYSALCAAGVYTFEKGLYFLFETSPRYQEIFPPEKYGMAVVIRTNLSLLKKVCEETRSEGFEIYVSNINCRGQYVISGKREAFERINAKLPDCRLLEIPVNVPSHTPLVKEAEARIGLSNYLDKLLEDKIDPIIPIVSTVTGEYAKMNHVIRKNLETHLSSPVEWEKSVEMMLDEGFSIFIEVGPASALLNLIKTIAKDKNKSVTTYKTATKEELENVLNSHEEILC